MSWQSKQSLFYIFLSGENSGSHCSPSHASLDDEEQMFNRALQGKWKQRGAEERKKESEAGSSSIEEEVLTVENNSLCSENIPSVDEKGTE